MGGEQREFNEGRRGGVISWFHFVAPEERTMLRCLTMPGALKLARTGALTPTNASTRRFGN